MCLNDKFHQIICIQNGHMSKNKTLPFNCTCHMQLEISCIHLLQKPKVAKVTIVYCLVIEPH